ncbi:MAG: NAD-binding protein, partial [Cyanobacteria bacterium J06643_4]
GAATKLAPVAVMVCSIAWIPLRVSVLHSIAMVFSVSPKTAPVVGSRPQADAQKLISLVGGETHIVERIRPILSASSSAIHHIGTARQAMAMKLAVNSLFGIQVAALTELLGVLNQQGISPKEAMTYFSDMPVTSLVAKGAGTAIVNQQYAPMFPVQLVEKDFRYACQMVEGGEKSEKRMPATTAVQQIYQEAIAQGYGSENITAIAKLFL